MVQQSHALRLRKVMGIRSFLQCKARKLVHFGMNMMLRSLENKQVPNFRYRYHLNCGQLRQCHRFDKDCRNREALEIMRTFTSL